MKVNSNSVTGQRFINAYGTFDASVKTSLETGESGNESDNTKALMWIGYNLDRIATSLEYITNKQKASENLQKEATESVMKAMEENLPTFLESIKNAITETEESTKE